MSDAQKSLVYRSIFLVVILLIAYGNTLNHGFVWDDINILVDNPLLEKLSNIPKLFVSEDIADDPTGYYRPVTYLSFALEHAVWGINPVGYNITNLLLHIAVALLFFRTVAALFKNENLALAAALLFSLHPIAGETVNFHAGGRNTLLCAAFALGSLLYYMKEKRALSVICFTLAIFSKEFALLLPAVFLFYDWRIKGQKPNWLVYLPYVVASVCYLALRSYTVKTASNLLSTLNISDSYRLIPQTVVGYLQNMLLPVNLKVMYETNTMVSPISFICYSLVLCLIFAAAYAFRKRNEVTLAILLFLLFLLPVTNIFPLGSAMMADRYAYFASFGFSLGLAYLILRAQLKYALPILAFLGLAYLSVDIQRNGIWKDEFSFFTKMAKDSPNKSIGFQNLGYAYYKKHDYPNAERYLVEAYNKNDVRILSSKLVGTASLLWEMKSLEKALVALDKNIVLDPKNPLPYILASRICEEMGNNERAASYHAKAVGIYPGIYEMMQKRTVSVTLQGEALVARHRPAQAEQRFKEALSIDPVYVPALIDMGGIVAEKGDFAKAETYFARAATLDPKNPVPHYNLSIVYESLGRMDLSKAEMAKFTELEKLRPPKTSAPEAPAGSAPKH
jgi:protein O-mannosyl-transferase